MARCSLLLIAALLAAAALAAPASAVAPAALLAPVSLCPGQSDSSAPAAAQESAMLCLVNYARRRAGIAPLRRSIRLMRATARKANDLVRCGQFSHTACGLAFTTRMSQAGYHYGCAGENIAMGPSSSGSPRAIMLAWLHSSGHLRNLMRRGYREQG
ncbi:MAG TPA: CAP domain-containing protein, partial [Solirubrobacteraceae bacterium]|nr:CAP domain-containing protein [Solirubrobacteraceae bacterium]